ncbi:transposase [Cohnella faecalis]|nr:transposase [Cohnella faecalis]
MMHLSLLQENMTFEQFCTRYRTERDCIEMLIRIRWPDGYRCPICACAHAYQISTRRLPLFECRSCRYQASVISGTIFEGSRTSLSRWFQAIYLHANPSGISATRLSEIIGVTYKTAWLIGHKLRHAMQTANNQDKLTGNVQISFDRYGSLSGGPQFIPKFNHPMVIGASINRQSETEQIMIRQIYDEPVEYFSTRFNGDEAFANEHVDISKAQLTKFLPFHNKNRSTSTSKLAILLDNWLNDTFHGIGAKHLQAYIDQFCYRFNMLKKKLSSSLDLLRWCAITATITYKSLVLLKTRRQALPLNSNTRKNRFVSAAAV